VLFSASVLMDSGNRLRSIAITERDITQEKRAAEKITRLNLDLQKNMEQLQETNRELESFSYSVSHDLRAPLRALNGYSQMLEEDFHQVLDEEGRRLLGNIRYNAKRMGMLIDDLLAFSRMGRKEVQKVPVDMREMIAEVLHEQEGPATQKARVEVLELPTAYADRALLRQVWTNLISNALKYSSKVPSPRIVIGCTREETSDECVYYVRDNGIGFNMEYAAKLFGVFQRLHSDEEFEGTGVGLAIVQRIISRHGGRVWARSAPGEGATFYFSLPQVPT
jgi:light-regulated signal transduction histidine kinase (bacteriophytochrome)